MNDNYFEKCHLLMNKLSKQNKQIIKLQVDFADLKKENEQLKQSQSEAIELILDAIVEMHDGKRDYAEKLLNEAIGLI